MANYTPQEMSVIERYEAAHERAFPKRGESDYVIPFQIMRDYLDFAAIATRHEIGEYYGKALVLDSAQGEIAWSGKEIRELFRTATEKGWAIRVRGQKWQ